MRPHSLTWRNALLALALSGTLGAGAPAMAQNAGKTDELPGGQGEKGTMQNTGKTGEGPRGTPAAPSTNPGQTGPTASSSAGGTGAGPRGTPGAPSTNPAQTK